MTQRMIARGLNSFLRAFRTGGLTSPPMRSIYSPRVSAGSSPETSLSGDQSVLADGSLASNVAGALGDYAVNLGTMSYM